MNISPQRRIFNNPSKPNIYRLFLWLVLILAALWVIYGVNQNHIARIGEPTPTSTRSADSYASEGDAFFAAGELHAAISAYQNAVKADPRDAQVWARMARIQTYSSALTTSDAERDAALRAALVSANQANTLAPDDSDVAAIRSFVLDWNASVAPGDQREALLLQAELAASHARQLDNKNVLALAYNAEILIDQQKFAQAEQYITQAQNASSVQLMDVHRVYAYLFESKGDYNNAIQEYEKAIQLAPNMTFLYLFEGANYRTLAIAADSVPTQQKKLYLQSLDLFAQAAQIDTTLGVKDPIPYLSIAKTYSQMGDYFFAGRNVLKALKFRPNDPDIYGQLGIIFFKSRNYEGAQLALQCAVSGCTPQQSCDARNGCDADESGVQVKGLVLSPSSLVYYYIYASDLAALSRPSKNYCPDALPIFKQLRAYPYGQDADGQSLKKTVLKIVTENETICNSIGLPTLIPGKSTPGTPGTPSATPRVPPTMTPTLTPTPTSS